MRLSATNSSSTSCTRSSSGGGGGGGGGSSNTCTWNMRYHMMGNNNDWTLRVYVNHGTNHTLIHEVDGYHKASSAVNYPSTSAYIPFTYDLMPSFAGQDVKILLLVSVGIYGRDGNGNLTNTVWQADTAVDDMKVITNGVSSDYSGYNATQRNLWRSHGSATSISAAQGANYDQGVTTTTYHRTWNAESGYTGSQNTGPAGRSNGSGTEEYIYFEASTSNPPSITKYYGLKMLNTFTVPS